MPAKKKTATKTVVTFKRTGKKAKGDSQKKAIVRLMSILGLLDKGRSISTKEVAASLDVDQRTIQRDLKVLKAAGYPVEPLENGRYQFIEGFSLRKFSLTEEQASLLSFMFDIASDLGETFEASFRDLFNRLRAQNLESAYYVKVPAKKTPLPATTDVKYLEAAILGTDRIKIGYKSAAGVEKEYCLEPLKIAFFDGFWYLIAVKKGETQIKKYRVDRMKEVTILEETFIPRVDIDKVLGDSVNIWFDEVRGDRVLVRVDKDAAQYFKERKYLPLQNIVETKPDGALVVETFPVNAEEIKHIIMHWIPCLTILEPASLKAEIKAMVEGYLKGC